MTVFKCKMCGGTIEFEQGATVGTCEYCGTKQTLPRLSDDRRANLYDRANHFRRNNEFDKAAGIYEQILTEDNTDAEAYWSLVLCQYGIEYVEDPATKKRVPTVNRAQFTSIFDDDNYRSALRYADGYQRALYEEEAKAINDIQKGILAISQKEEPFDVFICYKETDKNGRRTPDSVLANELYHQLTQEGFKVFFSRITLEDKLGTAYEPYIFAALNSAKVMVALGTKPEHFNAVWVKNEWSRYLALVKKSGGKKTLIPAYRDMDPYDLPEEFSHLQALDMSKLGFMQDLIRGIKKLTGANDPKPIVKETVIRETAAPGGANAAPLLERAFLFLEDGKWQDANIYCEKVLDLDPKNAQAYLGKLMADLQVKSRKQLADCAEPFDDKENYGKVIRFGDDTLEAEMRGYIAHINDRNENARLNGIYNGALAAMRSATTEAAFKEAAKTFRTIPGFQDADALASECLEKAEIQRKDVLYVSALQFKAKNTVSDLEKAISTFNYAIPGWRDADEQINVCRRKIEEIRAKEEADRLEAERIAEQRRIAAQKAAKKRKKVIAITALTVIACIAFLIVLTTVIIPKQKLNKAMRLLDSGDYEAAYAVLEEIGNSDAIASSKYDRALALIDSGDYDAAFVLLNGLDYKDSEKKAAEILIPKQIAALKHVSVGSTIKFGSYEQDNNTSNGKEEIEWIVLAKEGNKVLVISKYALDCQQYNTSRTDVTWETCTLRTWLNDAFYKAAFDTDHRKMIISSTVTADKNPAYNTSPGNNTTDNVFLLSITEVNKYFSSDEARKCAPTDYAIAQGAWTNDSYKTDGRATCWWWLRSPGNNSDVAAYVSTDGSVYYHGCLVDYGNGPVRPALWINLGS